MPFLRRVMADSHAFARLPLNRWHTQKHEIGTPSKAVFHVAFTQMLNCCFDLARGNRAEQRPPSHDCLRECDSGYD